MPQIFEVGGCIRDEFLGLKSKDIDYTYVSENREDINAAFSEMTEWMKNEGFEIFLSTPEMVTIRAKFPKGSPNENTVADFVLARKEIGYSEYSRRPQVVPGTLYDDLSRRDFTCNAIARSIDGEIIDPFNGVDAIKRKELVTPLDPMITFYDDPLRILRAMRFSITKQFKIEYHTYMAMLDEKAWSKFEKVVKVDRIRDELTKCFRYDTIATLDFLNTMSINQPEIMSLIFANGLWLMPTNKEN